MSIVIHLAAPIMPDGVEISATIGLRQPRSDLNALKEAIKFVHDEADIARTATPGERTLTARFDAIEKQIIAGLPPEVRLGIANDKIHS